MKLRIGENIRNYRRAKDITQEDFAKAFDERPEEQTYHCLLFGTVTEKRADFETSDTRCLR